MSLAAVEIPTFASLNGPQRSAILVMYLERDVARAVLEHFTDQDLEEIGAAMATIDKLPGDLIEEVVAEFVRDLHDACLVPETGPEFALRVLPELVEAPRRDRLVSSLRRKLSTRLADEVAKHPSKTVAALLADEHPQTCAVALLLMGEDEAAAVLGHFEEEERNDVAQRMAQIKRLPAELVDDVEESLLSSLQGQGIGGWEVPGLDRTAKVLSRLNVEDQEDVLDGIAEDEPELSDTLRRRMVVFDDLAGLDDRSMQALLKSIERDKLVIALRGCAPSLLALVLNNMSSRAAADLEEEIDVIGPKPLAVVEEAREEIVQTVLRLRDEGVLVLALGGGGSEMV